MTNVSKQQLSSQVYNIMQELSGIAKEIDVLRQNNQNAEAENKMKELKSKFKQIFGADETVLQLVELSINQDAQYFNDFLVSTLNGWLSETEFFDDIEQSMVDASKILRDEPYGLGDDESVTVQKIGFLIAVYKKTEDPASLMSWSKSLVDYLDKDLEVNKSKSQEIIDQLAMQNDELFGKYYYEVVWILYIAKITNELSVKKTNFLEPELSDIQQQFDDKQQSLIQLLKHMEEIVTLKETGSKDVSKLEQEWGKFNKILEQDFGATAIEVHEIGLALDKGTEEFKEVFAPFMIKYLQKEFPFEDF